MRRWGLQPLSVDWGGELYRPLPPPPSSRRSDMRGKEREAAIESSQQEDFNEVLKFSLNGQMAGQCQLKGQNSCQDQTRDTCKPGDKENCGGRDAGSQGCGVDKSTLDRLRAISSLVYSPGASFWVY